jgi:hypothetical protein
MQNTSFIERNFLQLTSKPLKIMAKKSKACSKVLRLMDADEDANYGKALRTVIKADKRLSKAKLEKELNTYI